jgi:two-component system chemotaxis response regulator CheB
VAVGVSTGGPNALHALVPHLPANFPVPIVCVQHMPPLFTASLAERLDRESPLKVVEAVDGSFLEAGTFYIAPGGFHMVTLRAADGRLRLSMRLDPPVHSCRPSVDVLFHSVAEICPGSVISVVLTGMGSDGAAGVGELRAKGAWSIVQDEATSVVWGMPGAVHAAGDADEVLPLEAIAGRLAEIVLRKGGRP